MNKIKLVLTMLTLGSSISAFSSPAVFAEEGSTTPPPTPVSTQPNTISDIPIITIPPEAVFLYPFDYYVSPTGSDSNNCTTPSQACLTINGAIAKVTGDRSDAPKVISLAAGNYAPFGNFNKHIIIKGHSALDTRVDGEHNQLGVLVAPAASVILEDLAVVNGKTEACGAAIRNQGILSLNRVAVMNNVAANGGGICNERNATLDIADSSITGNVASANGGGIHNSGRLSVVNTTISLNWANGFAGGVFSGENSHTNLSFVSITYNASNVDRVQMPGVQEKGAGLTVGYLSYVNVKNSILAGNVSGRGAPGSDELEVSDCYRSSSTDSFLISGANVISESNCTFSNRLEPSNLALIGYHGGFTLSQLILAGSSAIDAATDCTDLDGNPVDHDQRGIRRNTSLYGACDVGAFEGTPVLVPYYMDGTTETYLASLNMGSTATGTSVPSFVRLKNIGQKPLNATGAFSPATGFSTYTLDARNDRTLPSGIVSNCDNVQPNQTCLLGLRFSPTEVRAYNSTLSFTGNNPAMFSALAQVAVTGIGTEPGASTAAFSLSSTPGPNVSLNLGSSLSIVVTLRPNSTSFAATPTFSLEGTLPERLIVRGLDSYNPTTRQMTLVLSAGSDTALTTTPAALQIRAAVAGGDTVNLPLNVTVNRSGTVGETPPLTIALSSSSASVVQGQTSASVNISLARASFPGVVTLSLEGDNVEGVSANFTPNNLTGSASTVTFTVAPSAAAGVRNLRVVASSGDQIQRANFTLTVVSSTADGGVGGTPPPADDSVSGALPGSGGGGCSLAATSPTASLVWMFALLPLLGFRFRRRD